VQKQAKKMMIDSKIELEKENRHPLRADEAFKMEISRNKLCEFKKNMNNKEVFNIN
jgi:hypothetical protein